MTKTCTGCGDTFEVPWQRARKLTCGKLCEKTVRSRNRLATLAGKPPKPRVAPDVKMLPAALIRPYVVEWSKHHTYGDAAAITGLHENYFGQLVAGHYKRVQFRTADLIITRLFDPMHWYTNPALNAELERMFPCPVEA